MTMSNSKGVGYFPRAECIVAVPSDPAAAMMGQFLGMKVIDHMTLDNRKIVKLKAKLPTGSSYTCVGCGKSSVNSTGSTYWVVTLKDSTRFESSQAMCGGHEAVFKQEWLIPIGGADLLVDETLELVDDMKSLAEKVTEIPQPAN